MVSHAYQRSEKVRITLSGRFCTFQAQNPDSKYSSKFLSKIEIEYDELDLNAIKARKNLQT